MSLDKRAAAHRVAAFFFRTTAIPKAALLVAGLLAPPLAGAAPPSQNGWKKVATARPPSIDLKDLDGKVRTLAEFRGKVVVLNFWATWCEPCIDEMPSLQQFRERHAARGVEVIGVNLGEGKERVEAFLQRTGARFPVLLDRDGVAKNAWKVNGVPATYVIGRDGRLRLQAIGQLDFADPHVEKPILDQLAAPVRAKVPTS